MDKNWWVNTCFLEHRGTAPSCDPAGPGSVYNDPKARDLGALLASLPVPSHLLTQGVLRDHLQINYWHQVLRFQHLQECKPRQGPMSSFENELTAEAGG